VVAKKGSAVLVKYESLLKLWEVFLKKRVDPDVRARIIGCDAQLKKFEFFFGLHLSQRIFAHTGPHNLQVFQLLQVRILPVLL